MQNAGFDFQFFSDTNPDSGPDSDLRPKPGLGFQNIFALQFREPSMFPDLTIKYKDTVAFKIIERYFVLKPSRLEDGEFRPKSGC